jgi:hypothetical protein
MVYTGRKAGMRVPLIVPGAQAGRAGDAPIRRDAMQTTNESNLSTILWTAGALAVVAIIAIYMGMN